jgi:hypothetical protein
MWGRSTWSVDGGVLSRSHPYAQPARPFRVVQGTSDRQQAFQLTAGTNGLCAFINNRSIPVRRLELASNCGRQTRAGTGHALVLSKLSVAGEVSRC